LQLGNLLKPEVCRLSHKTRTPALCPSPSPLPRIFFLLKLFPGPGVIFYRKRKGNEDDEDLQDTGNTRDSGGDNGDPVHGGELRRRKVHQVRGEEGLPGLRRHGKEKLAMGKEHNGCEGAPESGRAGDNAPDFVQSADEELIDKVLTSEDRNSFELIIERYRRPAAKLACRMTGDYEGNLEVAQEIFIKAWRYLKSYRREMRFSAWLFKIASNVARDFISRRQVLRPPGLNRSRGEKNLLSSLHIIMAIRRKWRKQHERQSRTGIEQGEAITPG
jgi:DNA-directed RNA polymerase specialized sigma24 family protein